MSKKVEYICNLCSESDDGYKELIGVNFGTEISGRIELKQKHETECHICKYCAEALVKEYKIWEKF